MESNALTREQTIDRIQRYLSMMTDRELRMVLGFARGIAKEHQT